VHELGYISPFLTMQQVSRILSRMATAEPPQTMVHVNVPRAEVDALDAWIASQPIAPSRAQALLYWMRVGLNLQARHRVRRGKGCRRDASKGAR